MEISTNHLKVADATQDNVELLREILTREQHREVTYDEAIDIGESLLDFFEVLAGAAWNDCHNGRPIWRSYTGSGVQ